MEIVVNSEKEELRPPVVIARDVIVRLLHELQIRIQGVARELIVDGTGIELLTQSLLLGHFRNIFPFNKPDRV